MKAMPFVSILFDCKFLINSMQKVYKQSGVFMISWCLHFWCEEHMSAGVCTATRLMSVFSRFSKISFDQHMLLICVIWVFCLVVEIHQVRNIYLFIKFSSSLHVILFKDKLVIKGYWMKIIYFNEFFIFYFFNWRTNL